VRVCVHVCVCAVWLRRSAALEMSLQ